MKLPTRRRLSRRCRPSVERLEEILSTSTLAHGIAPAHHGAVQKLVHAQAAPLTVTVQGRVFQLVHTSLALMYSGASYEAQQLHRNGHQGALARLNTPEKYQAVVAAFGPSVASGAWLGASRNAGDPNSPLIWNNSTRVGSYAFLPGEPNNFRGRENKMALYKQGGQVGGIDVSENAIFVYYIAEFSA